MMRSSRYLAGFVAIVGLAAIASAAGAATTIKHHHPLHRHGYSIDSRPAAFPNYIDTGSDRNPGGDNLYFTDTKSPLRLNEPGPYIIGPAYFQRWWD
jgi:hypothetical protein